MSSPIRRGLVVVTAKWIGPAPAVGESGGGSLACLSFKNYFGGSGQRLVGHRTRSTNLFPRWLTSTLIDFPSYAPLFLEASKPVFVSRREFASESDFLCASNGGSVFGAEFERI